MTRLDAQSDEALVAAVAAGDKTAFRWLAERHMGRAIRVAQGITGAAEADDIAQEAFLRIWKNAASFNPDLARFTTWMHRIVVNLALDRIRRPEPETIDELPEIADEALDPLSDLIASEEQRAMQDALTRLPERQRAAIALFHFEGLSGRESALAMDLTDDAFESLLARARASLQRQVRSRLHQRGRTE